MANRKFDIPSIVPRCRTRCPLELPVPPESHNLELDRERTGDGEKWLGSRIFYNCRDPGHGIEGTQVCSI